MFESSPKKLQLEQLFNKEKCWTMKDLCRSLNYSGRSVQRLLKDIGYYSSFTHNGKWYTLQITPEFDVNGLWFYQDIGFSKCRHLTSTILYLIENSVNGLTANNLSKMLSTSCPPILNRIFTSKKVDRIKTSRGFVYISTSQAIKKRQLRNFDKTGVRLQLSNSDTITILVEFIKNSSRTLKELALQLEKNRISCSDDILKDLFIRLGLEKKIPKGPQKS